MWYRKAILGRVTTSIWYLPSSFVQSPKFVPKSASRSATQKSRRKKNGVGHQTDLDVNYSSVSLGRLFCDALAPHFDSRIIAMAFLCSYSWVAEVLWHVQYEKIVILEKD